MNRRTTLKQLLKASGGMIALPSWAREWSEKDFKNFQSVLSNLEQQILASVTDSIIPAGNSIGALSVGVDKFLQKLLANCYEQQIQDNVQMQLTSLDTKARKIFSKSFPECDLSQRQELLLTFSVSENKEEKDFFNLMKSDTIRGFSTSKEVMTKYLKYKVAPGHYYGCVEVKS